MITEQTSSCMDCQFATRSSIKVSGTVKWCLNQPDSLTIVLISVANISTASDVNVHYDVSKIL
jgi:hypothetical protein